MAERVASARPSQLRLRPARPDPQLQATIVARWKCRRCGTLHLDRTQRDSDAIQPQPYDPSRRKPYTYASTTKCCGEDWCFRVTPLPAPEVRRA